METENATIDDITQAGDDFSAEQKQYLQGFVAGSGLRSLDVLPTFASTMGVSVDAKPRGTDYAPAPENIHLLAQDRFLADGKKLTPEELAKRKMNGLDVWDKLLEHARDDRFPKGTDVFMIKFLGMFYVAPAQDAFMCRLRFAGGISSSAQLRGVADLAKQFGGGYADCTTRANLQIREIPARHAPDVLMGLYDLGIVNRGAGADNIRNITGTPTAGIDPQELIDTRALCKQMHHYILNHRELYGLPRKFNIAFDGAGTISALEDTNDIGFTAVHVGQGKGISEGVYFRLTLGGITGHKDFARDTGVLLKPEECVPVAGAIVRAFIEHGDRTDRRKSRLKYVLDRMGFDGFLAEVEKHHAVKLLRFPLDQCDSRPAIEKHGHLGIHPQKQPGMFYVGVVLPVGRMTCDQMHALAAIADKHGSGTIRLTVWQNLLISDIPREKLEAVKADLTAIGLGVDATNVRGGLVACTGNAGCKYAAANTKKHAMEIVQYLEQRMELDVPINIHLTGCHNSCAQHFIGDIGLIGTKVPIGEEDVEGYNIFVGGGYGAEVGIGREMYREVAATDCPHVIERMLRGYVERRTASSQSFLEMVRAHS
ncbi:MAG: NirA family protein, partial [Phycisphaerae bacterium]|nr:NirA family protein [Phycisphaerae bacterium]